jgi:uncharacterized protein (DUF433 family)
MLGQSDLVSGNEDVLGGIPVFSGTHVPVKALFDYLQKGHSIHEFLDDFPTVTHQQVQELLTRFQNLLVPSTPC